MTPDSVGPLSRPYIVGRLPEHGAEIRIEANAEERAALAFDLKLVAIHALGALLRIRNTRRGVRVTGRIEARIAQTCVVSLDEFDSRLDEDVDVEFAEPDTREGKGTIGSGIVGDPDYEPPDEIVDGRIDLGSITAEFFALGLDPYPRKPGVAFEGDDAEGPESPFAVLAALRKDEP